VLHPIQEDTGIEVWEVNDKFEEIRSLISRISVIKRTNFLPAGGMLMRTLVVITVVLVTLAQYDNGAGLDVSADSGGGRRRLSALAAGALGGDDAASETPFADAAVWFRLNVSNYISIGAYCFLFIYALFLVGDLEDPYEYSTWSLMPTNGDGANAEGLIGNISARHVGGSEVDPYPLLELYCRLAALAGKTDVTGSSYRSITGLRPAYSIVGPGGPAAELIAPSDAVSRVEHEHDQPALVLRRTAYRRRLAAATFEALESTKQLHTQATEKQLEAAPSFRSLRETVSREAGALVSSVTGFGRAADASVRIATGTSDRDFKKPLLSMN